MVARLRDAILYDTRANQPAASAVDVGSLYFVSDEDALERSNGSAWQQVATLGLNDTGEVTYLDFVEAAPPATPAAGRVRLYALASGAIASKDDAGAETEHGAGGGGTFSGARVTKSVDQTGITAAALVPVTFDTAVHDTDSYLSADTLVAPTTGHYRVFASVFLNKDASDIVVAAGFQVNAANDAKTDNAFGAFATTSAFPTLGGSADIPLTALDAVRLVAFITSGTTRTVRARTTFGLTRLA